MSLKINFNCLRTNKQFFFCLRTNKTLSLGEFDESKSHIFLSSFFMNIYGLKVQFNAKLWSLHTDLCFAGI